MDQALLSGDGFQSPYRQAAAGGLNHLFHWLLAVILWGLVVPV